MYKKKGKIDNNEKINKIKIIQPIKIIFIESKIELGKQVYQFS
jgi:hypothetical protein